MTEYTFFKSNVIDEHITEIRDSYGDLILLLQDKEKAILIDTGFGMGSLKAYVDELTGGKPVTVILTHGHMDHSMGAPEFEDVYMSPLDERQYYEHSFLEYRDSIMKIVLGDHYDDLISYMVPSQPLKYEPLLPGMTFSLEGLTLKIFSAAGHTHGSVAILFEEKRILLLGDSCNNNTLLLDHNATDVRGFLHSMEKLQKDTEGLYDQVYFSHGPLADKPGYIASAIKLAKEILDGDHADIPYHFLGHDVLIARPRDKRFRRPDGEPANIGYKAGKELT